MCTNQGNHMPAGRPKKTLDDLPKDWREKMLEIAADGGSAIKIRIQALGGISKDLWYRLIEEDSEFSGTVKECEELCSLWWEQCGQNMAKGELNGNPTVWIFNMKNRFGWRDKLETEHKGKVTITATSLDEEI